MMLALIRNSRRGSCRAALAGALLAVVPVVLPGSGAHAQNVTISSGTVTNCGEKQTATVSVDDATGAFAFDLTLAFDCAILAADPPVGGDCTLPGNDIRVGSFVADCALCGTTVENGTIRVGIGCTQPRTGGGTLLEIDFTPWANGTSAVSLTECSVDESACVSTTDGTVQVNCSGHEANVSATVAPQGRPDAPDPTWSAPVAFSITATGGSGAALRCSRTTDDSGGFSLNGLSPGTYRACARRVHRLQNCVDLTLGSGTNDVDFGVLREGDATGDNCVLLLDFSQLAASFGLCAGNAGFNENADFDDSGCVQLLDFSLLSSNFAQCGDELSPSAP